MRTFPGFPHGDNCPICNTNRDEECCLVPIVGTSKGNCAQAIPVHVDCIINNAMYSREANIIFIGGLEDEPC